MPPYFSLDALHAARQFGDRARRHYLSGLRIRTPRVRRSAVLLFIDQELLADGLVVAPEEQALIVALGIVDVGDLPCLAKEVVLDEQVHVGQEDSEPRMR